MPITFDGLNTGTLSGTRESPEISLASIKRIRTSAITFTSNVPITTTLVVETNVALDGVTWLGWKPATSGNAIPDLPLGTDVTLAKIKVRHTLSTTTLLIPSVLTTTLAFTSAYMDAEYVSKEFEYTTYTPDASNVMIAKTTTNGTVEVYSRVKARTGVWSEWEAQATASPIGEGIGYQFKVNMTPDFPYTASPSIESIVTTIEASNKMSIWYSEAIDVSLATDVSTAKAIFDAIYHGGQVTMYSRSKATIGGTWTAWSLALEDGTLTHTPNVYVQIMLILVGNAEVRELTLSLDGDASVDVIKSGMTPGAAYGFTILDDLAVIVNGNDQPLKWDSINPPALLNADPPILSMVLTHHNRAWGVDSETPSRLRYSNILDPTKWDAYDFIDFNPDDGDTIMAIVRYGQNLVVSKQRSMALLTGNRSSNYNVSWLDSESGATGMNAICVADKYLAYVAQDGIRFTDLAQSVIATERLNPSWAKINKRRLNQAALIYWKNRLFAALPSEGSLYNDTVWVYDFLRNSWSIIDGWEVSTWQRFNQYGEDILLAGDSTTGQLYHVDVTSYDDTIPVEYEWRSKDFNFKAPEKYKLFRNVFLDLEGVAETTNLYVDLIVDGDVKGTYNTVIPAGEGVKHTRRILPPIYGAVLGSAFGLRIRGRCGVQSITIQYAIRGNIPGGEL